MNVQCGSGDELSTATNGVMTISTEQRPQDQAKQNKATVPPLDFILPHDITERELNVIYHQLMQVAREKGTAHIRILSPRSPPIDPPTMPNLAVDDRMDEGPSGVMKRMEDNDMNELGDIAKKLKI